MKKIILTPIFFISSAFCFSQSREQQVMYKTAFDEMIQMIQGAKPVNFRRAVFLTENVHYNNTLDYQQFCSEIEEMVNKVRHIIQNEPSEVQQFKTIGNWAIFMYMTQPLLFNNNKPFQYDFEHFLSSENITNGFVTKLLKTGKGNCHSLPYLYKILADKIGANATIAYAPLHVYIKHIDENGEWRNVELTNGSISRDIWIMQTLHIDLKQISSGLYMRPLVERENIAACISDMINDYVQRFKRYDILTLAMIESVLAFFPNFYEIALKKADNYSDLIVAEYKKQKPDKQLISEYKSKEEDALKLMKEVGYKKVSTKEYVQWVQNALEEKRIRDNQK